MINFSEILDFDNEADFKKLIKYIDQASTSFERLIKITNGELGKVVKQQKELTATADKLGAAYKKKQTNVKDYATQAEGLFKQDQQLTSQNIRLTAALEKLNKENGTVASRSIELLKLKDQQVKLTQKLNSATTKDAQAVQKLKVQIAEKNKRMKEAAKESLNMVSAYDRESKKLNELRKSYKAVAIEEGINSKRAKEMRAELNKLDTTLKKVDASAGQYQRSVGNYEKALRGFKNIVGALGIVGGIQLITSAVKSIINVNKDFEKSLSSLRSITGATTEDLKFYSAEAKRMGATTTQSASEVVKAFEIVGSKKPELLQSKEALAQVTEQAIALAEASGMAVPEAAEALTGALNQFGAGADEAGKFINALAAGSKEGAANIQNISDAMKTSGTVLKSANVSFERSVGLIETLAEKQIMGAQAGTNLRNITLKLMNDQENYKDGVFDLQFALERLNKENLNSTQLTKQFGLENITAAKILIDGADTVNKYTEAVTGTNTAYEQQKINTDNLQGSIDSFNSKIEALILSFNGNGGLTKAIRAVIDVVGDFVEGLAMANQSIEDIQKRAEEGLFSESYSDEIKALTEGFERLTEKGIELSKQEYGEDNIKLLTQSLENQNQKYKENADRLKEINKYIKERGILGYPKELQKERDQIRATLPSIQTQIELFKTQIKATKDWILEKEKEADVVDKVIDKQELYNRLMGKVAAVDFSKLTKAFESLTIEDYIKELDEALKKQNEFNSMLDDIGQMQPPDEELNYQDQLDMIEQKDSMSAKRRISIYRQLQDALVSATGLTEARKLELHQEYEEKITEILEGETEKRKDLIFQILDFAGAAIQNITAIFGNLQERTIQNYELELEQIERNKEAINERYEREMDLAGDNDETKELLAQQQEQRLEREKQKELEVQRAIAMAERKQAIFAKVNNIAQASINTALAITQSLPNIPLSIAVGIIGGLNVAAIASEPLPPIPQFATGTMDAPSGEKIVGEEGSEMVVTPEGKLKFTPNKATKVDDKFIPEGSKIIPADATKKLIQEMNVVDERSVFADFDNQNESASRIMDENKFDKIVAAALERSSMRDAKRLDEIAENVADKALFNFQVSARGFEMSVERGGKRNNYIGKKYKI